MCISSPVPSHNLVQRNPGCLLLPQDDTLIHHIDVPMLLRPSEQEVEIILDYCKTFVFRGWGNNMTKIQRPSTSVKFLGVQ